MDHRQARAIHSIALLLGAWWAGAAIARETIDFQVMVIPDRGRNAVTSYWPDTSEPTCTSRSHVGCYEVPAGEEAEFRVTLTNGDDSCTHQGSWRLKAIVLGGEGDVNDPPAKPGADGWGNISEQAARDFNADPATGIVKASVSGNTMTFQNLNTAAYSIWYKVQVESCAKNMRGRRQIIEFDPRIDNRGRS